MKSSSFGLFFLFVVVDGFDCPPGSSPIPNEQLCLYPIADPQFYQDAVWQCGTLGGVVSKVTNAFENSYIFSMASIYFTATQQWIGVQKLANGSWSYQDHSALTYRNWAPDEPRNASGYNCALMTTENLRWSAADCSQPRPCFCVLPPLPTTIQTTLPSLKTTPLPSCPTTGYIYFDETGYCYYIRPYDAIMGTLYSFSEAESWCREDGGHLASVHSAHEDDFVYNMTPRDETSKCAENHYVWLGLDNGDGNVGSGRWTDGTPVDYSFGYLGGTGYLGIPKVSTYSGDACSSKIYDWYSTWVNHKFGRFICKQRPRN